jgi:hypothetical protein
MSADDSAATASGKHSENLSGSYWKSEELIAESKFIFSGEIIQIGPSNSMAAGGGTYNGVQVKVLQNLKGSVASLVSVDLFVNIGSFHEVPPEVGKQYVFFVKEDYNRLIVRKLVGSNEKVVASIQGLIQASGK